MVYKIKLNINGKKEEFKRTQPPFLKEITRALILQQHQVAMYSDEKKGPTDKELLNNSKEVAQFAVEFWNNQFSVDDVLNGADSVAMTNISDAIDDALGVPKDDTETDTAEAKK